MKRRSCQEWEVGGERWEVGGRRLSARGWRSEVGGQRCRQKLCASPSHLETSLMGHSWENKDSGYNLVSSTSGGRMQAFFSTFEPKDWVNFGIALTGVVLSLLFGVFQVHRDRKRLRIILSRPIKDGGGLLVISNAGHRPITVTDIHFRVQMQNRDGSWIGGYTRHDGPGLIHAELGDDLLPKLLNDGDRLAIRLPESIFETLKDPLYQTFAMVKGGDDTSHTQYRLGDNWPRKPQRKIKVVYE